MEWLISAENWQENARRKLKYEFSLLKVGKRRFNSDPSRLGFPSVLS